MKVLAVVQARMGSSRFPGKVLELIAGRPMLAHVVERVRRSPVDTVVVATSTAPADDAIAAWCAENGVDCYRGSEHDVLDRFRGGAAQGGADVVVRITADCPLIDPAVIAQVIQGRGGADYATNCLRSTYPDGLDVEAFTVAALERAWLEARAPADREHVTSWMRRSRQIRIASVERSPSLGHLRWTVDEPADLVFVRAVYDRLGGGNDFGTDEVLALLEREPDLKAMMPDLIRNEGYYRSLASEPALPAHERRLERSRELFKRAARVVPGGSQTFSKAPSQFVQGVAPNFVERGSGCRVWDVDGNEYIDWAMGLGPVILGYAYKEVDEAVASQVRQGVIFSQPHTLEVEVAEMLVDAISSAEMVRFGKNGSDATAGAVRAARAFTGRDLVVCAGYHGWQDWYIGTTTRSAGVPKAVRDLTMTFTYNDLESLERVFAAHPGEIAATVLEPVGVEGPVPGFLEGVRDLARREGAVLVFDEVITGFRFGLGGAQEHFGIRPDLTCCGKAMGNGYPISAVAGRHELMQVFDDIFFSFTFGGETASLAATRATINVMRREPVFAHVWEQGARLHDGYNALARAFGVAEYTACLGLAPRTVAVFRPVGGESELVLKSIFQQECIKRGVLFTGSHNVSFSHSAADVDQTLRVYRAAFEVLAEAIESGNLRGFLAGEPVQPVFRRP